MAYAYINKNDLEIKEFFQYLLMALLLYNPGEIGPFSAGIIEAFLNFSEIGNHLKNIDS